MKLVEQRKLDLDKPIQEYCVEFPRKSWPITTRQLLTHTSGIRHYVDYEAELAEASSHEERANIERRQSLDTLGAYTRYTDVIAPLDNFKNDHLLFEPGTNGLYSSFGYRVLACILEGASSIVVLVPDQDLSIAVLTNVKGRGGYLRLVREIHAIVELHIDLLN